jgi:SagB-type dehydrogenase family enzyme
MQRRAAEKVDFLVVSEYLSFYTPNFTNAGHPVSRPVENRAICQKAAVRLIGTFQCGGFVKSLRLIHSFVCLIFSFHFFRGDEDTLQAARPNGSLLPLAFRGSDRVCPRRETQMIRLSHPLLTVVVLAVMWFSDGHVSESKQNTSRQTETSIVKLPPPRLDGPTSLEQSMNKRRSVRVYGSSPIGLGDVSQLLWAAQGITNAENGHRTAPSAGALYPLEVYIVAGNVTGLAPGVYKYGSRDLTLTRVREGDVRSELYRAALEQESVRDAAAVIVLSAVYERTAVKYRQRAERYVHMEVGHAAQNVLLQAVSLGLGSVPVGAFDDAHVKEIVCLETKEQPLYLIPAGKP